MNTVLWDEKLRPGYTPKNQYKEGFNSPRVPQRERDAFAVNADFIPFVADPETPTVYPNVPKLPEMPYDDLTFEQIRNLAAQQRADALGADGRPLPSVATEIPNFPDNTAPDMNSAEPAPWVPRDPRTAANVTEQEGERETSDEFGIPMDSRAAFEARLAALRYSTPPRRSSAPASPSTPSSASSMTSPAYSASPPVSPSRAPTSPTTSTWSSTSPPRALSPAWDPDISQSTPPRQPPPRLPKRRRNHDDGQRPRTRLRRTRAFKIGRFTR